MPAAAAHPEPAGSRTPSGSGVSTTVPASPYRMPLETMQRLLTFNESKQAMTRPFSTWQLFDGCANLHSVSGREHVPLWNSRHTSSVSHLVSRMGVTLTAIVRSYGVNVQHSSGAEQSGSRRFPLR